MVEIDTTLIEHALEGVLHGHSFSSSKQCQALLRHIVKYTLSDQGNMLRERVIGAEVFGRSPDYDTGNDPVVRSRAAEVRKRLAQHYHQDEPNSGVRIHIPSGSYRATFDIQGMVPPLRDVSPPPETPVVALWEDVSAEALTSVSATPDPVPPSRPEQPVDKRSASRWSLVLAGILAISVALLWPFQRNSELTFEHFWSPFTHTSNSVIVYFGGSYTYHLSPSFLADYRSGHSPQSNESDLIEGIRNGKMLNERSLVPVNPMIGYGDVAAVARVASTLTRLGKKYDLRYGSDLTVTDLHASSTVLIGGFSNMWTLEMTRDFPYTLDQGGIYDRQHQRLAWAQSGSADGLRSEDYVIVSRIPNSALGSASLYIAGLNTYSNQAAADFLGDPEKLRTITRSLTDGWEKKNLQIVLHTTVINQVPITADVVAVRSW